jgi:hypothetical protein
MGWPTLAHRSLARTSTHPEQDDADLHANPIPRIDRRSSRQRYPMARIGSPQPRRLPQPSHPYRRCTPERPSSGRRHPISCPVSRAGLPQTAFNPHTLTALAPYSKSPYPHCSAPTALEHQKVSPRSTADTALEIWHKPRPYSPGQSLGGAERVSGDLCILRFKNLPPLRHYPGLQNHV